MIDSGVYALVSGARKNNTELLLQSHNLANMNNNGFKADFAVSYSAKVPARDMVEAYPSAGVSVVDTSQGSLQMTGRALDAAIVGSGWFKVLTPAGVRYTRNGAFTLNNQKVLVTNEGFPVLSADGQQMQFDINDVDPVINGDGSVMINNVLRGSIGVVSFANEKLIRKVGNHLYISNQPEVISEAKITQGALEQSNVNSIAAITTLMAIEHDHTLMLNQIAAQYDIQRSAIKSYSKLGG